MKLIGLSFLSLHSHFPIRPVRLEIKAKEEASSSESKAQRAEFDKTIEALKADISAAQSSLVNSQEECKAQAAEVQRLRYQTEHCASVFEEKEGLEKRLSLVEVRLIERDATQLQHYRSESSLLVEVGAEAQGSSPGRGVGLPQLPARDVARRGDRGGAGRKQVEAAGAAAPGAGASLAGDCFTSSNSSII